MSKSVKLELPTRMTAKVKYLAEVTGLYPFEVYFALLDHLFGVTPESELFAILTDGVSKPREAETLFVDTEIPF